MLCLSRAQLRFVVRFNFVEKVLKYFVLVYVDASALRSSLCLIITVYYMRMQC